MFLIKLNSNIEIKPVKIAPISKISNSLELNKINVKTTPGSAECAMVSPTSACF